MIEQHHPSLRGLDVHMYRDAGTRAIIDSAWDDLKAALLPDGGRSLTLVSKVMMGVWGCVPSYDTYFLKTFRELAETREERGAFSRAGVQSRLLMADLWDEHQDEIDGLRHRFPTLDLTTGKPTGRPLTRAKVIDIFAFQRAYSP